MKNGGPLWHLTSLNRMVEILKSGVLYPTRQERCNYSNDPKNGSKICFTRRRNCYSGYYKFNEHCQMCMLEFDSDKLNNYKIKPYDYIGHISMYQNQCGQKYQNGRELYAKNFHKEGSPRSDWDWYDQTEERLFTDKPLPISNALTGIEIILNWDYDVEDMDRRADEYYRSLASGKEELSKYSYLKTGISEIDHLKTIMYSLKEIPYSWKDIKFYSNWDTFNKHKSIDLQTIIDNMNYALKCSYLIAELLPDDLRLTAIEGVKEYYKDFNNYIQ